jgi:hypothetical protein
MTKKGIFAKEIEVESVVKKRPISQVRAHCGAFSAPSDAAALDIDH